LYKVRLQHVYTCVSVTVLLSINMNRDIQHSDYKSNCTIHMTG